MATTKNITMKQFNGTDYDTLYPKTKVEQVENLTPSSIGAVAKSGDTMTGQLSVPAFALTNYNAALEIGKNIDFHVAGSTNDYDARLTYDSGALLFRMHGGDYKTILHTGNLSNLSVAKIATGSYVGTGTFGVNNPCSLTFPFSPKILIFFERHRLANNDGPFDMLTPSLSSIGNYGVPRIWLANTNYQITHSLRDTYGDDGVYVQVSWGVTTQWYAIGQSDEADAMTQLNTNGQTYDYCAIG